MFMAPEMAVGIVFGFGVLKEIIDHLKYKGADVVDLFFTVLPAIIITITENIKTWQ